MRTRLPCPRVTLAAALLASSLCLSSRSEAQVPSSSAPTVAAAETNEARAHEHFDRALELYRAGHYAEALEQLQRAAELDPNGKDLFFNLALVHEKLGQLPQAIAALERFRELETDPAEQERARLSIERLRGASQTHQLAPPVAAPCPPPPSPSVPPQINSPVLIGAASVAAASLVFATVFGVKALSDDVSHASTSAEFPVSALHDRGRRAEREALIADVAFAIGAASAATFAGVWLLSPRDPAQRAAGITLRGYF